MMDVKSCYESSGSMSVRQYLYMTGKCFLFVIKFIKIPLIKLQRQVEEIYVYFMHLTFVISF